jgi:hypothetical protein
VLPSRATPVPPRKPRPATPPFPDPAVVRSFTDADGRTYSLQVIDCRVYENWTKAAAARTGASGGNVSTRDSDEDAQSFAGNKVRTLLKKGYVEDAPRTGRLADPNADVVEVLRRNVDYKGDPRDDFKPLPDRANVFRTANISVHEWLVTSDDRRRGILLMCKVWESTQPETERETMALALVDLLVAKRDEILADARTPVRKLPLLAPIGRFTHLVVLSPVVENHVVEEKFTISRSLFRAFPAYDCEMGDADTVTLAEARTSGRGALPQNTWDRKPHPVVDIAYLKKATETPAFLVYDPKEMERRLGGTLTNLKVAEVRARNWRGEVRSFHKGQTPPDRDELRGFFGFED